MQNTIILLYNITVVQNDYKHDCVLLLTLTQPYRLTVILMQCYKVTIYTTVYQHILHYSQATNAIVHNNYSLLCILIQLQYYRLITEIN